jgi:aspartate/methionine/tyrosine aminotransferase
MEGLTGDQTEVKQILQTLKKRRDVTVDILNSIPGVRCFRPNATFYLFPNVTDLMRKKGMLDYDTFRKAILTETGVSVCSRLHFGRPLPGEKNFYMRLAYSGINIEDIQEGLGKLKVWAEK